MSQPEPIQIEAGKYYATSSGYIVGPMRRRQNAMANAPRPWISDHKGYNFYRNDGRTSLAGEPSGGDLVREADVVEHEKQERQWGAELAVIGRYGEKPRRKKQNGEPPPWRGDRSPPFLSRCKRCRLVCISVLDRDAGVVGPVRCVGCGSKKQEFLTYIRNIVDTVHG